jgi:hypothetical protein
LKQNTLTPCILWLIQIEVTMAEEGEAADERKEPTFCKKLKTSEPDLSITCRQGENEKTFHCQSAFFTLYSMYFDTLLASGMREGRLRALFWRMSIQKFSS